MQALRIQPPVLLDPRTHPAGNAIIVSGPLAAEIGLASGGGCLGPSFRANVTIGRTLNLSLVNAGRALPGQADLSTIGSPAELAFCCTENAQASPWPLLHVDLFDAQITSVTVLKCEAPHNVLDHLSRRAESLVQSIADGWSKQDVQRSSLSRRAIHVISCMVAVLLPCAPRCLQTWTPCRSCSARRTCWCLFPGRTVRILWWGFPGATHVR